MDKAQILKLGLSGYLHKGCRDCWDCWDCVDCGGCVRCRYMVSNVQLTKDEYQKFLRE